MVIVETTLKGGARNAHARRTVKKAEKLDQDSTNLEIIVFAIKTDQFRDKTFNHTNKSASNDHTIKIYQFPGSELPADLTVDGVQLLNTYTVAKGTDMPPKVFRNDYRWMFMTQEGASESSIFDSYFIGSKD